MSCFPTSPDSRMKVETLLEMYFQDLLNCNHAGSRLHSSSILTFLEIISERRNLFSLILTLKSEVTLTF